MNNLTITLAFNNRACFKDLLRRTGCNVKGVDHLVDKEGFTSMKILIDHIPKTDDFKRMLENINKSFASLPEARKIFYGTVIMVKMLGVHYYSLKCVSVNKIPDIRIIDIASTVDYMAATEKTKTLKLEHQKDWNQVPKFNGDNWASFKTKLITLLKNIVGVRDVTLDYIFREDDGSQAHGLVEETAPDLSDNAIFSKELTLTGPDFKADSARVFNLMAGYLIDTPAWNHIKKHESKGDGRKAWQAL